jgi:hypothetical protein
MDDSKCHDLVYKFGKVIGTADSGKSATDYCEKMQKMKGGLWDWYYVAGRAIVKHLTQESLDNFELISKNLEHLIKARDTGDKRLVDVLMPMCQRPEAINLIKEYNEQL